MLVKFMMQKEIHMEGTNQEHQENNYHEQKRRNETLFYKNLVIQYEKA